MAKEGAKVVVTTRKKLDEGRAVAEDIKKAGGEATFMQLDVSVEDDWKRVVADTVKKYGKLNIVVNNAGISVVQTIEEATLKDWNQMMAINATGVYLGTKYGILTMKDSGEPGSIINISTARW